MSKTVYALNGLLFYLWGFGGGYLCLSGWVHVASMESVGVGTSGVMSMSILMWIGGMILFGMTALIHKPVTGDARQTPNAEATKPDVTGEQKPMASADWSYDPTQPRMGDHSFAGVTETARYAERDYKVHGDGRVVSMIGPRPHTWRSEAGFKHWADRNPVSTYGDSP